MKINEARKEAEYLLKDDNVVGVGIGRKERIPGVFGPCIVVSIVEKTDYLIDYQIPITIHGWPTNVIETGKFVALQDRMARWRPAPGGVSIGHFQITTGTLGCLVSRDGEWFILSNNHVLANMNNARIGDEILQPGKHDGGIIPDDVIATLEDFVEVKFILDQLPECPTAIGVAKFISWIAKGIGSKHRVRAYQENPFEFNLVDAAIAKPMNPDDVIQDILELQAPTGHRDIGLGEAVIKSGRTTGVTRGKVTQIDATLQVMYGTNIAVFEQQIVCDAQCGGGDSGSIVLADDDSGNVVGLLFAGSEDGSTMIMNKIEHVLDLLNVTI